MMKKLILLGLLCATPSIGVAQSPTHKTSHHIAIKGMQFVPNSLVVHVGDEVVWSNEDIVPHTATGKDFDSGEIKVDQTWKMTIKKAGTLSYKCTFHPTMTGTLKVAP